MIKRETEQIGAKESAPEELTPLLGGWLQGISDLLFPPSCQVCGARSLSAGHALCSSCLHAVSLIRSPLCRICGCELADSAGDDHLCGLCLQKPPPYSSARGLVHYQKPVSTLLHRLKYQGNTSVLSGLHEISALQSPFVLLGEEVIIPVPLHVSRLRQRGFNQAILLAELLFPNQKTLIQVDTLARIRRTVAQTGLDGAARRKNLHQAFTVRFPERVQGKIIILVDDVFTTGSTVHECAKVLQKAGAARIEVITLARAMYPLRPA